MAEITDTRGGAAPDDAARYKDIIIQLAVATFTKSSLDLAGLWDDAKERLGVDVAGSSVDEFVRNNTKTIDLDPWAQAERDIQEGRGTLAYSSGSNDPLTYECVIPMVKLAPSTEPPRIVDPALGIYSTVDQTLFIVKRGEWYYAATLPEPGEGLQLQPWEKVITVAARFTVP